MTTTSKTNPDRQYVRLLRDVTFRPIFIMGDHRSGTTLLYQLLNTTQCFNVVTAYHIIRYGDIVYNHINRTENDAKKQIGDYFSESGLTDRIIDGVRVSPDLPEEYGFILRNVGYRAYLSSKNLPGLIELCKKVQFVSDPGKPLLLKNPWDFANFIYVRQVFPEAKFVFIHRNPINVINSLIKAMRSILSTESQYMALIADWYKRLFQNPLQLYLVRLLFSSHFELGFKAVRRHVSLAANYFLKNVCLLSEKDFICVRYEDLCEDPRSTIKEILAFLGEHKDMDIEYSTFIQTRQTNLLDEVERNRMFIINRLERYFTWFGYG